MPGLLQRGVQFGHAPATACSAFGGAAGSLPVSNAIWSRQREDVSFDLLRKFWCELPIQARRELLRIDKQTLCEQARKNLYCSRCHGLLWNVTHKLLCMGRSFQQEITGGCFPEKTTAEVLADNESDHLQDPCVHPWGGLATTKDGMLTLLDCFICASSPDVIHKVFSGARQREHDRELLYPDACGGEGRGWISQGLANYGRVHGARETCALHTSRLSCDTLLDFWSALGDETRSALLHMKEEDFIERLMYRFDSKRFCRDCRRNVLREFKELKELKRLRKELRCTSWFCVADTAIQYEVSEDSVIVDWQHSFTDTSTYHHFEWAIGTAEGKSDILDFEDVGMNGKVEVKGLDLSSFSACFITLRAWKLDGRCTELSVKAHALNGQTCVHRRLVVGDGFVTITKGDSIKCFFEHAEEVEEEEDDDSIDKDGIELDGDGSRPQKHAKSPELAREFLLDAATVIFKEQVEKAFREGTARQNSHSLFVSLAIKLLEDCVRVACKEIITLEKQIKLLEEEENEKREEEERKERRRNKEREKKLRRKERLKEKEKDRGIKLIEEKPPCIDLSTSANNPLRSINDESLASTFNSGESLTDPRDDKDILEPTLTDLTDDTSVYEYLDTMNQRSDSPCRQAYIEEGIYLRESTGSFLLKQSKSSRRKLPFKRASLQDQSPKWYDKHRSAFNNVTGIQESCMKLKASSRCLSGGPRPFRERVGRMDSRNCVDVRFSEKFRSSHGRILDTSDSLPGRSNHPGEYRLMDRYHISTVKGGREVKGANTADSIGNLPRQLPHYSKHNRGCYASDNCMLPKGKLVTGTSGRDPNHMRQIWEPMDARKKYNRINLGSDLTSSNTAKIHPSKEITSDKDEKDCHSYDHEPSAQDNSPEFSRKAGEVDSLRFSENQMDHSNDSNNSDFRTPHSCQNGFSPSEKPLCFSKDVTDEDHNPSSIISTFSTNNSCHSIMISSSSDSCSSCPSEGDSSTSFSSTLNVETSSTSDSEDVSQQLDQRDNSTCNEDACLKNQNNSPDSKFGSRGDASQQTPTTSGFPQRAIFPRDESNKVGYSHGVSSKFNVAPPSQHMLHVHNQLPMPTFPSEIMGYENQNTITWSGTPINGLMPFSQHNHYMFPTPVGYGLTANRSSGFAMQYNTLQPIVFNLEQHRSFHGISKDCRAYPASLNEHLRSGNGYREEQVTELAEPKPKSSESKEHPLSEGNDNSTTKSNESNKSFSLFHFGGPLVGVKMECTKEHTGTTLKPVESLDTISCSMEETKIEEYSLFAAKNSSRFLFSSFTL
ncbi:hypothetical protein IEQ34_003519 [Dendrobium chrysotoxum]|uniref:Uncharacterized protein n=1 Tax=Dendrobium chrysotoxum TaxID=161865 RepID=A0AAV7HIV4_DENCH|nr:hypothetical protein IEQ34_003519 [Dendrobium chrysotoxum]